MRKRSKAGAEKLPKIVEVGAGSSPRLNLKGSNRFKKWCIEKDKKM